MFRKLLIASVSVVVLMASAGVAQARHYYKGDYKGEMVAPPVAACYTYPFPCGPYLGLSVGVRNNYTGLPVVYKGLEGIISLGYGAPLTPMFYLAGEIFAGDSIKLKNYTNGGNGVRSSWNYGFDLIPGIKLTNYIMGYLRLGVVRTRFSNQETNVNGWRVGIGAQTNLCDNWDLRTEYVYTYSRRVTGIGKPQSDQFNLGLVWRFM